MKLNCDLGEGFGNWQHVDESLVMPHIDMANVACGYHAGDPMTILRTVRLARAHSVQIGAHPSYPDLVGFGRRSMSCHPDEIAAMVLYQLGALQAMCTAEGGRVEYVKPHGALYQDAIRDESVLRAILTAVAQFDNGLPLMLLASPKAEELRAIAAEYGVSMILEAFADRRYTPSGALQPRAEEGAVLHQPQEIVGQVLQLVEGRVTTSDGSILEIAADTICVHGDNAQAVKTIAEIRRALDAATAR